LFVSTENVSGKVSIAHSRFVYVIELMISWNNSHWVSGLCLHDWCHHSTC